MATRSLRTVAIALAVVTALAILAAPTEAQKKKSTAPPVPPATIEVQSEPVAAFDHREPTRRLFGQLEYRGGLVLTSKFKEFGGFSSINVAPDGSSFLAATDRSWWLRGRIVHSGTRPTSA